METSQQLPQECQRQPDESTRAFAAFIKYCEMGDARSLAKLGRDLGKSRQLLEGWSTQHNWVARANVWDRWSWEQHVQDTRRAREEMVARHAAMGKLIVSIVAQQLPRIRKSKLSPGMAAKMARIGAELERKALGDPKPDDQVASVVINIGPAEPESEPSESS